MSKVAVMLSADLHNLAATLYDYRGTGGLLTPEQVDGLWRLLIDFSERAMALESCAVAPASRHAEAYEAAADRQKRHPLHVIEGGRK
ncbi:MAG: hypothetical protein HQL45_14155 [Alphaproteobacteria bacterium]|nr:hypothetical protein [Alphaproteobacteria bacterium]